MIDPHAGGAVPTWDQLLKRGIDTLMAPGPYLWAIGAGAVIGLLTTPSLAVATFGILPFLAGLINLWISLVLTRQIMTGQRTIGPNDGKTVLRLLGAGLAIAIPVIVLSMILVLIVSPTSAGGLFLLTAIVTLAVALIVPRFTFYLPALAVGDETSLMRTIAETKPYYTTLLAIVLAVGLPTLVCNWILGQLGLPDAISGALQGAIGVCAAIVATVAICRLYVTIRPRDYRSAG